MPLQSRDSFLLGRGRRGANSRLQRLPQHQREKRGECGGIRFPGTCRVEPCGHRKSGGADEDSHEENPLPRSPCGPSITPHSSGCVRSFQTFHREEGGDLKLSPALTADAIACLSRLDGNGLPTCTREQESWVHSGTPAKRGNPPARHSGPLGNHGNCNESGRGSGIAQKC